MVETFGNDIKRVSNDGTYVSEIYSFGVKVWPIQPTSGSWTSLPSGDGRIHTSSNVFETADTVARAGLQYFNNSTWTTYAAVPDNVSVTCFRMKTQDIIAIHPSSSPSTSDHGNVFIRKSGVWREAKIWISDGSGKLADFAPVNVAGTTNIFEMNYEYYFAWNNTVNGHHFWLKMNDFVYNESTSRYEAVWPLVNFNGLENTQYFQGRFVWTNQRNGDTHYDWDNEHYVKKFGSDTWEQVTWNVNISDGRKVWYDNNDNMYYSDGSVNYILDYNTWKPITLNTSVNGTYVWHDKYGNPIYMDKIFSINN